MAKAVIIGGSNGIGLAICKNLATMGYDAVLLDKTEPMCTTIKGKPVSYIPFDLMDFDEELITTLSSDAEVEVLVITAGFGRVADLEFLHLAEIENVMRVNAIGTMKILRIFYERIHNYKKFYTMVMGSIAGLVSSPMFSTYAASKAAVCRFVESVNIELEVYGTQNRILNVSPGSIKGTKFNGGENDLSQTARLAEEIVEKMLVRSELYIPDYETTYRKVLEDYYTSPHDYGLNSYQYKKESGRAKNEFRAKIGYLSGTFDLFHVGHLNLLRHAKEECDYLIVGVHKSGRWKGKETFIPFEERKSIVASCRYVDKVVESFPEDSDAWEKWHYNRLFVGSDYKGSERFKRYESFFANKGVKIIYFPYTKSTSSTQIRKVIQLAGSTDD